MNKSKYKILVTILVISLITLLTSCSDFINADVDQTDTLVTFVDGANTYVIPQYNGKAYIDLMRDPVFIEFVPKTEPYEEYSALDKLGRCTLASAVVCRETIPKSGEKRGSIRSVKPTGWIQAQYDCVPGKMLYNRCHLIGWQLTAENANKRNLITGTRYMNIDGMIDHENMVAAYVKEHNGYVAYQVTPIYNASDLVALGVHMEGYSINDNGTSICFNIFCYNVQPGVNIDYTTGRSQLSDNLTTNVAFLFLNWQKMQIYA